MTSYDELEISCKLKLPYPSFFDIIAFKRIPAEINILHCFLTL